MTAPSPLRRGACPSLSAPMPTGDGILVRLQPESGAFSPAALGGLAQAAARHGNGILEITARGNLQIRGLDAASAAALAGDVVALGIAPRTGLPLVTGPLAGLDPSEVADPRPLAGQIRRLAAARGLTDRLGPKVSVVVDGGGWISLTALTADIRVEAIRGSGENRWRVGFAGTRATATFLGSFREGEAIHFALELLERIAAGGRAARGRDLLASLASLPPAALKDARGGTAAVSAAGSLREQISLDSAAVNAELGTFPIRNGSVALAVALPFGRIEANTLAAFSAAAAASGSQQLRLAPGRALLALFRQRQDAARLKREAAALGLITNPDDPRRLIVACAGWPGCASSHLDTLQLASALAQDDAGTPIHVSGCAKRCAEPAGLLPAIVGLPGGEVTVSVGDRTRHVAADEAPRAIRDLLRAAAGRSALPPAMGARA